MRVAAAGFTDHDRSLEVLKLATITTSKYALEMRQRSLLIIIGILTTLCLTAQDSLCDAQELGKIQFRKNSAKLTVSGKAGLDRLILTITKRPSCEVLITSYYPDFCDKCGALSWRRLNSVINYIIEKGVSERQLRTLSELAAGKDFVSFAFSPGQQAMGYHPRSG